MEMTGKIQEVDYKIVAGLVPGGSGEGIRRHGRHHTLFDIGQAMPSYAKLGPTLEGNTSAILSFLRGRAATQTSSQHQRRRFFEADHVSHRKTRPGAGSPGAM